jgi:hypothetical protein
MRAFMDLKGNFFRETSRQMKLQLKIHYTATLNQNVYNIYKCVDGFVWFGFYGASTQFKSYATKQER